MWIVHLYRLEWAKASGRRYPGIIIYRAKNKRKKEKIPEMGFWGWHIHCCVVLREEENILLQ
jgi:hypothetical protein